MTNYKEINAIERARGHKKITAYRLCKDVGVDLSHYYQWRKGCNSQISKEKVEKIKEYLGIK